MTELVNNLARNDTDTIRVNGRIFSITKLIEEAEKNTATPAISKKFLAVIMYILLLSVFGIMSWSWIGGVAVFLSLFVHEIGHLLGMKVVGWYNTNLLLTPITGPVAVGNEGISAGRKAAVALSGPALGLMIGMSTMVLYNKFELPFLQLFSNALLILTAINMLPLPPFDGGEVINQLLFVRYPKTEMGYFALEGVAFFLIYIKIMANEGSIYWALFFLMYAYVMFMQVKRNDNLASLVTIVRKDAANDFKDGRYSVATVKRLEYSLSMFDVESEVTLAPLLREIWDRARDIPASIGEVVSISMIYLLLGFFCIINPVVKEIVTKIMG